MLTFIIRRLLTMPLLLLGVSLISFILLRSAPGDFFDQMRFDPATSLKQVQEQRAQAGLAKPIPLTELEDLGEFEAAGSTWRVTGGQFFRDGHAVPRDRVHAVMARFTIGGSRYQLDDAGGVYRDIGKIEGYVRWLGGAIKLDFGRSYSKRRPVWGLIIERLWNTLKLSIASLVIAWGIAIPLGVAAAVRQNSLIDHISGFIAFFGLSIPSMFFALLMVLFAAYTGWFPIGDMRDVVNYDTLSTWGKFKNQLHHLVLPSIVIATGAMAGYMRQARGNMLEVLGTNYVRTARAKGLAEKTVLFKHALRNAINPLVTLFGYSLAALLSGSFLVEVVMNWPGMARLVVDAIFAKDEPIVMAAVLMGSILLVLGNLAADMLLPLVDPRVRVS